MLGLSATVEAKYFNLYIARYVESLLYFGNTVKCYHLWGCGKVLEVLQEHHIQGSTSQDTWSYSSFMYSRTPTDFQVQQQRAPLFSWEFYCLKKMKEQKDWMNIVNNICNCGRKLNLGFFSNILDIAYKSFWKFWEISYSCILSW